MSDKATTQDLQSRVRATRFQYVESLVVNGMSAQLCHSTPCSAILFLALFCSASIIAQNGPTSSSKTTPQTMTGTKTATSVSPCFELQGGEGSKQHENHAVDILPRIARFWLTEDVVYIISAEERCAFLHLKTDEERNQFIEQFWYRRASNSELLENGFKQEHYRRIVFANEKFGTQISGWKTDRGRVYITLGPPDSIESHASGEKTGKPPEEGVETYQYAWLGVALQTC